MRTTQKYSLKDGATVLIQYFLSRIGFWYFKHINSSKITLIRKQGIGDSIFITGVVKRFREEHPETHINLVTNHPEIFDFETASQFSLSDFPWVWMTYGHYDFRMFRKNGQHITQIIGGLLGLKSDLPFNGYLNVHKGEVRGVKDGSLDDDYIVIHPWAGKWNLDRNWPQNKWDQLVKELKEKGRRVVQIGGEADPPIKGALHFNGKMSLEESLSLIDGSRLFIGVNSFGEQAAGALSVPSIILYGPTNPLYSLNFKQVAISGNQVIRHMDLSNFDYSFTPVDKILVQLVLKETEKILNENSSST